MNLNKLRVDVDHRDIRFIKFRIKHLGFKAELEDRLRRFNIVDKWVDKDKQMRIQTDSYIYKHNISCISYMLNNSLQLGGILFDEISINIDGQLYDGYEAIKEYILEQAKINEDWCNNNPKIDYSIRMNKITKKSKRQIAKEESVQMDKLNARNTEYQKMIKTSYVSKYEIR